MFKKVYILHDYSTQYSIVGMAGKGFHAVMQHHLLGMNLERAIDKGVEEMEKVPDSRINFGKTGSREKMLKDMMAGVNFYLAELPDFGEILSTERTITTDDFEIEGHKSPLPLKAVADVVSKVDGKIFIHDHKLVTSFTDKDDEQPDYIMQAMFNYMAVKSQYGEPEAMYFHEVKKSKNRDGSPQVQTYSIIFKKHPEYLKYFGRMYSGIIYDLSNENVQFLPNFGDYFSGKESWEDFTAETLDFDVPKRVSHKSKLVKNVDRTQLKKSGGIKEETNFVPSIKDLPREQQIIAKLQEFGIHLKFDRKYVGLNITLYAFEPSRGVQMKKLRQYEDDVALALGAESVRIEAPILGTQSVGIEVPNEKQGMVEWSKKFLGEGFEIPIGQDVYKKNILMNLEKAPHLLVAGATGAGKSVFLNSLIHSLIKQNSENDLGLVLIDPKKTEFVEFNDSTHLLGEICTETLDIAATLEWLADEMDRRYSVFKEVKSKDLNEYNRKGSMRRIVVIIDELADLVLSKGGAKIEGFIIRLAQKARACGIHLVVATQRPSVDVVTGILKANFPVRVAFMTSTETDSRVILDQSGAERLIGNGDLLLKDPRRKTLVRLQGYFL
jgi:energy-coupling factor transporter ATP-binding protein EcfA2